MPVTEIETEGPVLIMDEDDARKNATRECAVKFMEFFNRYAMFVCGGKKERDRLLRFDCAMLAMGKGEIINHLTAASLARVHGVTSAQITQTMKRCQEALNLPALAPGQDSESERLKKVAARKRNLK